MPVAIVAIIFGSLLMFVKMVLEHKKQNIALPTVHEGNSMKFSELEQHILATVQEAIEPLVARIDELESAQLLGSSERLLLSDSADKSSQSSKTKSTNLS
ncbi:MAG: hypothetical protein O3B41_03260 [Bacteroidetes bacterium]|nr:hypothetical protein [Bacteroidota bacterium]